MPYKSFEQVLGLRGMPDKGQTLRRGIGFTAGLATVDASKPAKDAIATKTVARPTRWVFRHQLPAPEIGRTER